MKRGRVRANEGDRERRRRIERFTREGGIERERGAGLPALGADLDVGVGVGVGVGTAASVLVFALALALAPALASHIHVTNRWA